MLDVQVDVQVIREDEAVIGAVRKISYSVVLYDVFVLDTDLQVTKENVAVMGGVKNQL